MDTGGVGWLGSQARLSVCVSMERKREKLHVTRVPLDPTVLLDIDRLIADFATGTLRSFASFRQLASSWRATDLLATQRAGQRYAPTGETRMEYVSLLFEAIVRRLVARGRLIHSKLGALYLLLLLHELQPWRPRTPVPILETQWEGIENLAADLRQSRNADGFAALHALWHGGRFEHRAGDRHSMNALDIEAEDEAERAAAMLPAQMFGPISGLDSCRYAKSLKEQALPALYEAEAAYDKALADVLRDDEDGVSLERKEKIAPPLQEYYHQYRSGRRPPAASGARTAAHERADGRAAAADEGLGATYSRRQAVRHRPYAPGGRRHSQSMNAAHDEAG